MEKEKAFKIFKGQNFRILGIPGFPDIAFGCPPGLIKEVKARKQVLPSHYVIPRRTFVKGRNHFDFEFIFYTFLFFKEKKEKVTIYCNEDQRSRFKIIISETLYGPTFSNLLNAHFRKFSSRHFEDSDSAKSFSNFTKKLGSDKKLFRILVSSLKNHETEKVRTQKIREQISLAIKKAPGLTKKKIARLEFILTQGYMTCAKLKREFDLFSLTEEKNREQFIEDITDFHIFDNEGYVVIVSPEDRRKKIKIKQPQASVFEFSQYGKVKGVIDMSGVDKPKLNTPVFPSSKPSRIHTISAIPLVRLEVRLI